MTDTTDISPQARDSFPWVYFLSVYSVGVGALYQWGYWGSFRVNVLEYMDLADIVKNSLYPVATAFLTVTVGMFVSEFQRSHLRPALPPGGGRTTPLGQFLHQHLRAVKLVYLAICLGALFIPSPLRWVMLGGLISAPLSTYLDNHGVFAGIESQGIRNLASFALLLLPFSAFAWGQLNAEAVLSGKTYSFVVGERIGDLTIGDSDEPTKRVKHLGQVGGYTFFLLPDHAVQIVSFDKLQELQLRHIRDEKPAP